MMSSRIPNCTAAQPNLYRQQSCRYARVGAALPLHNCLPPLNLTELAFLPQEREMCNGRARKKAFYKVFHTALMVGLVRGGGGLQMGMLAGVSPLF